MIKPAGAKGERGVSTVKGTDTTAHTYRHRLQIQATALLTACILASLPVLEKKSRFNPGYKTSTWNKKNKRKSKSSNTKIAPLHALLVLAHSHPTALSFNMDSSHGDTQLSFFSLFWCPVTSYKKAQRGLFTLKKQKCSGSLGGLHSGFQFWMHFCLALHRAVLV